MYFGNREGLELTGIGPEGLVGPVGEGRQGQGVRSIERTRSPSSEADDSVLVLLDECQLGVQAYVHQDKLPTSKNIFFTNLLSFTGCRVSTTSLGQKCFTESRQHIGELKPFKNADLGGCSAGAS